MQWWSYNAMTDTEKLIAYIGYREAKDKVEFLETVSNIWFVGISKAEEIILDTEVEFRKELQYV